MLILSREKNMKVMIGDNISVVYLGMRGNQIRLGFDAPKKVAIHREEIYELIKRKKGEHHE